MTQTRRPETRRRSRIGRPYRHLRRWSRHTPNGEMALTLICAGIVLIVVALLVLALAT